MMLGNMTLKLPVEGLFEIFEKDLKIRGRKPGCTSIDIADAKMTAETTLNMTLLHTNCKL